MLKSYLHRVENAVGFIQALCIFRYLQHRVEILLQEFWLKAKQRTSAQLSLTNS